LKLLVVQFFSLSPLLPPYCVKVSVIMATNLTAFLS
jgi:hypothetical protein